jgi:hypothetical protein
VIWWWGKQYKDKADALAQGAYDNTTVEMFPLVTCKCCGENELDKIKWFAKHYDEMAEKAFEIQQARPRKSFSRASQHDYTVQYQVDMTYATNQARADSLKFVIRLLEGKDGCL